MEYASDYQHYRVLVLGILSTQFRSWDVFFYTTEHMMVGIQFLGCESGIQYHWAWLVGTRFLDCIHTHYHKVRLVGIQVLGCDPKCSTNEHWLVGIKFLGMSLYTLSLSIDRYKFPKIHPLNNTTEQNLIIHFLV